MRREFSPKTKLAAYERSGERCEKCGAPLQVGRFHYDHIVPDALGGDPTLENCAVVCRPCHDIKTRTGDVPQIAKMKRQQARHLGTKAPSKTPLPCGKRSPWKRTIDGRTVRRQP